MYLSDRFIDDDEEEDAEDGDCSGESEEDAKPYRDHGRKPRLNLLLEYQLQILVFYL